MSFLVRDPCYYALVSEKDTVAVYMNAYTMDICSQRQAPMEKLCNWCVLLNFQILYIYMITINSKIVYDK